MASKKYNVAVVGIGAVGKEMVRVLRQRQFPMTDLKVLARRKRDEDIDGELYPVEATTPEAFEGVDIAFFAGTEGAKGASVTFAQEAIRRGAVVIDNGKDFRLDPKVPLVIPEVNPEDLSWHKGLIASPNCSTIQMVVALAPLHRAAKVRRVIATTFQAVSGTSGKAIDELKRQTREHLESGKVQSPEIYPEPIAFNVLPHIGSFEALDYTQEEWKMVRESHKILHDDSIAITATTVRVPVLNVHSESVSVETERKLSPEEARQILRKAPGIIVIDEPDRKAPSDDAARRTYPTPLLADRKDDVFVGRIRQDPFVENALNLWVVCDNIRKGAALNTVQIAERLFGI